MELSTLGLNTGLIVGLIGLCEFIKRFDTGEKLKRFYPLLPLLLGAGASVVMTLSEGAWDWKAFAISALTYAGVASLAYNLVKKTFFRPAEDETPKNPAP